MDCKHNPPILLTKIVNNVMTKQAKKIESTAEAWEEGTLGLDEKHVKVSGLKIEDLLGRRA